MPKGHGHVVAILISESKQLNAGSRITFNFRVSRAREPNNLSDVWISASSCHRLADVQICDRLFISSPILAGRTIFDPPPSPHLVIQRLFNTSVLNPGDASLLNQDIAKTSSGVNSSDHLHVMIHPELAIRADYSPTRPSSMYAACVSVSKQM